MHQSVPTEAAKIVKEEALPSSTSNSIYLEQQQTYRLVKVPDSTKFPVQPGQKIANVSKSKVMAWQDSANRKRDPNRTMKP